MVYNFLMSNSRYFSHVVITSPILLSTTVVLSPINFQLTLPALSTALITLVGFETVFLSISGVTPRSITRSIPCLVKPVIEVG